MRRVEENFSNYSAWHERSATLLLEEAATTAEKESGEENDGDGGGEKRSPSPPPLLSASVLEREYDLVRQAVFTDPEDQAPWLYHRWLLSQSVERFKRAGKAKASGDDGDDGGETTAAAAAAAAEALAATLEAETAACEELLESEPDRSKCKWPLLTLARLSEARAWLERKRGAAKDDGNDSDGEKRGVSRKPPAAAVAIFEQLAELDPLRKNFYRDAASGRAFV